MKPVQTSPLLEKFNLEMDWNPSSCLKGSCIDDKVVNAFTISEMTAKLQQRNETNPRCWDKKSNQAKTLVVSREVSKDTLNSLKCVLQNSAGSDEELWKDLYVNVGSCTGLSPEDYFSTMTKLYNSISLNTIAGDYGLSEEEIRKNLYYSRTVDRDFFLDHISSEMGKKAWIECDPDTGTLLKVLACVEPVPPYKIIDCTMDRNDPTSTNGPPCKGELSVPIRVNASSISKACSPYFNGDIKMADESAGNVAVVSEGSVRYLPVGLLGVLQAFIWM